VFSIELGTIVRLHEQNNRDWRKGNSTNLLILLILSNNGCCIGNLPN